MEGLSKIYYKEREIIYVDYSDFRLNKERTIRLIFNTADEYRKYSLKSVLALVNFKNLYFDNEIINAFKITQEETALYQKKVALIGLSKLQVLGYDYIINKKYNDFVRMFKDVSKAKEWLISS